MKEIIKAVTLHRPWGNAIADPHYGKNIENRTWKCPLPFGSFLAIHNGSKWDADALKLSTIEAAADWKNARRPAAKAASPKPDTIHSAMDWLRGVAGSDTTKAVTRNEGIYPTK